MVSARFTSPWPCGGDELARNQGEVLAMTTAMYSWAGARTGDWAPGTFGWAFLAVLLVISALVGRAVSIVVQRRWREEQDDQRLPLIRPGAWGEPDLAPPSVSPDARAEVANLEVLWALPPHSASSGTD
jgi:hypothetical protein